MNKKRSKLLFVTNFLGVAVTLMIIKIFASGVASGNESEQVGAILSTVVILPYMISMVLANLFGILGYVYNTKGFVMASGVLYCVCMVLFIPYFMFVIPQAVMSFISYAKIKRGDLIEKQWCIYPKN